MAESFLARERELAFGLGVLALCGAAAVWRLTMEPPMPTIPRMPHGGNLPPDWSIPLNVLLCFLLTGLIFLFNYLLKQLGFAGFEPWTDDDETLD